jgi:hypothetical protein
MRSDYYEAWEWGYDKADEFTLTATVGGNKGKAADEFGLPDFGPHSSGWSEVEGFAVFIEGKHLFQRKDGELVTNKDGLPLLTEGWVRRKVEAARGVPTWNDGKPPFFPADVTTPNHVLKVRWNDIRDPKESTTIVKEIPKPARP